MCNVLEYVLHYFGYIPRSGIAGSYGNSVFNFLRNCQTVLHSGYIILHSHHQCMRTPISPHLLQHLFTLKKKKKVIAILVGVKVVSHCGLDLHFPSD